MDKEEKIKNFIYEANSIRTAAIAVNNLIFQTKMMALTAGLLDKNSNVLNKEVELHLKKGMSVLDGLIKDFNNGDTTRSNEFVISFTFLIQEISELITKHSGEISLEILKSFAHLSENCNKVILGYASRTSKNLLNSSP